jgi:putative spermidine/putrescine transport system permease protein
MNACKTHGEVKMKKSSAFIMVVPGLVILAVCLFLPLLRVLIPSFHTGDYPFSAYVEFFQDEYYLKIFMRTVKVAFITTAVCMTAGVPTAYFISRCRKKWRGILLSVSIFPLMTNSVIRSFAWINILGSNGIINRFLLAAGFVEKPAKLLYTDFSIIIGSVYLFLPLMIVTVAGVMENIDNDMMEAALSLGADRFKAFMKVIFPMSLPGIIVGGILVFTGTLTAYTTPQLLGGNKHMVLATFIYQRAMSVGDWNGAAVISLIMIVSTLVVIKGLNALSARLDRRGGSHA